MTLSALYSRPIAFALGSSAMNAVHNRAEALTRRRKGSKSRRVWMNNHDLVGAFGEAAFGIYVGAQVQAAWRNEGDEGVDIKHSDGFTYDVKSTTLSNGRLMMPVSDFPKNRADRFVLAIVTEPQPEKHVVVCLAGWIPRSEFIIHAKRFDLRVPTLAVDQDQLRPMNVLATDPEERAGISARVPQAARPSFQSFDERIAALANGEEV